MNDIENGMLIPRDRVGRYKVIAVCPQCGQLIYSNENYELCHGKYTHEECVDEFVEDG